MSQYRKVFVFRTDPGRWLVIFPDPGGSLRRSGCPVIVKDPLDRTDRSFLFGFGTNVLFILSQSDSWVLGVDGNKTVVTYTDLTLPLCASYFPRDVLKQDFREYLEPHVNLKKDNTKPVSQDKDQRLITRRYKRRRNDVFFSSRLQKLGVHINGTQRPH